MTLVMDRTQAVGQRLRRERLLTGYSQEELAKAAGVSTDVVYRLETGRSLPHPQNMRKLAKAVGVKVRDLLSEE
jgi:transcriptional regulator with XRE-family HTH domain